MKSRVTMVAVLVVCAAVSATLLGWVYNYTKPIVQVNQEKKLKRMVLDAFSIPYTEEDLLDVFAQRIEEVSAPSGTYYRLFTSRDGKKQYEGTAVELAGPGFWAPIRVIIALEQDMSTIRGFKVVEQAETPGLGGRMVEPWFQEQFKGKSVRPALHLVHASKASGPNEVDAITGATETSKALDRIINGGLASFFADLQTASSTQQ